MSSTANSLLLLLRHLVLEFGQGGLDSSSRLRDDLGRRGGVPSVQTRSVRHPLSHPRRTEVLSVAGPAVWLVGMYGIGVETELFATPVVVLPTALETGDVIHLVDGPPLLHEVDGLPAYVALVARHLYSGFGGLFLVPLCGDERDTPTQLPSTHYPATLDALPSYPRPTTRLPPTLPTPHAPTLHATIRRRTQ